MRIDGRCFPCDDGFVRPVIRCAAQGSMSVLGRDILNLFACIIDRPGDVVCLLTGEHRYRVEAGPP